MHSQHDSALRAASGPGLYWERKSFYLSFVLHVASWSCSRRSRAAASRASVGLARSMASDTPRRLHRIGKSLRSLARRFRPFLYASAAFFALVTWRMLSINHITTPQSFLSGSPSFTSRREEIDVPKSAEVIKARAQYGSSKMSALVLFHNEYDSLRSALHSWVKNGLVDSLDEVLFFVNGGSSEQDFISRLPEVITGIPDGKRRIVVSRENLKLGLAITRMVSLAKHELVLLLEKDWELIEKPAVTKSRLLDSKVIVSSGMAHLIRHRHRHNPGVPLHALIMHQGREDSIFRQQKNLLCYVHHWQQNPTNRYPGKGYMWRCAKDREILEERGVFCSTSEYCQWTNNPCVFKKTWFLKEVGNEFVFRYTEERAKYGDSSPFLDFEYYTNWRSYAWTDKNFTIAVGTGLFRHAETEHQHFNTFWYAHYRLETDYEEIRNNYLKNETRLKKMGGVHYDTSGPPPLKMLDRYPVKFVQKYHWRPAFTGNLDTQRKMIANVYDKYVREYRVTPEEWKRRGTLSTNYGKQVPWRHYITDLHEVVQRAEMIAPPDQPHEMSITLVTVLLDIGRHRLGQDEYQFRRDFKMYLDAMKRWMSHDYPKVVYTTKQIADEVLKTASDKEKATTRFVYTTVEELESKWLGLDNYHKVQEIRKSKDWIRLADWLTNSPQAGLANYNPLVMSKMAVLRDAARQNYWKTTHFVFLDSKHNCMDPEYTSPKSDHIMRAHMFGKLMLTFFEYTPANEVHGFEYKHFNEFLNIRNSAARQMIKVGRGGIFGGSAFVIEYTAAMFDVALTATLRMGLMGTEENILAILMYQVPQYIDPFNNNWACFSRIEKDHSCKGRGAPGYNCEIFKWMREKV